jgi:hypothetical protein
MNDDEIFELAEAAVFLKMSESWLERSDAPRIQFGRSVRFLKSELLEYAKAHLTHSVKREAA